MHKPYPRHVVCHTPVIVKSVIDDFLKPAMVLWCPTCETAMALEDCDRPIDVEDITDEDILKHVEDFGTP